MQKEIEAESILDCPVCRNRAMPYYASDCGGYFICCTKSDKITKSAYVTVDEAITAWNDEIVAMRKENKEVDS